MGILRCKQLTDAGGDVHEAPDGRAFIAISLPLEIIEDLAGLNADERGDLEAQLLGDVQIAVGLSATLRNRRMRERPPMAA